MFQYLNDWLKSKAYVSKSVFIHHISYKKIIELKLVYGSQKDQTTHFTLIQYILYSLTYKNIKK